MKPRLLDLFCGAGGAAMGYYRAGFEVVGVDIKPHRDFPFAFVVGDALNPPVRIEMFDAIHASPPCQHYSVSVRDKSRHPDLLPATRDLLQRSGKPWVIENVPGAPMRPDYRLCGCMFSLPGLKRLRLFETSWHGFHLQPGCFHPDPIVTVIGHGPDQHSFYRKREGGRAWELRKQRAMGIDWMRNREDLSESIPPAYTEFIGKQLMAYVALGVSSEDAP